MRNNYQDCGFIFLTITHFTTRLSTLNNPFQSSPRALKRGYSTMLLWKGLVIMRTGPTFCSTTSQYQAREYTPSFVAIFKEPRNRVRMRKTKLTQQPIDDALEWGFHNQRSSPLCTKVPRTDDDDCFVIALKALQPICNVHIDEQSYFAIATRECAVQSVTSLCKRACSFLSLSLSPSRSFAYLSHMQFFGTSKSRCIFCFSGFHVQLGDFGTLKWEPKSKKSVCSASRKWGLITSFFHSCF